jgi:hypothetical protein
MYNWTTAGCAVVLTVCYTYSFVKNKTGAKMDFLILICGLLIISNIASVIVVFSNSEVFNENHVGFFIFVQGLFTFLRDFSFNVAHWNFAYQYLISAISMPYIFEHKPLPKTIDRNCRILNISVLTLNIFSSFMQAIGLVIINLKIINQNVSEGWLDTYVVFRFSIGIEQLISGIFLIAAVIIIRRILIEKGLKD